MSKMMLIAILIIPILFQIVVTGIILFAFKAPGIIASGDKGGFFKTAAIIVIGIALCLLIVLVDFLIGFYLSVITRQNLTEKIEKLYMKDRFYLLFNTVDKNIDNADQRIAVDCGTLSGNMIGLTLASSFQVTGIIMGIYLLYVSPIGPIGLLIFLIIGILFYAIGFPLVSRVSPQVFGKEQSEGEFRFAHCRIREYAESIAFYGGESEEVKNIDKTFSSVVTKQALVARTTFPLTTFTTFFSNSSNQLGFTVLGFQIFLNILPGKFSTFKTPGEQTNALVQMNAGIKTFLMGITTIISSPSTITGLVGTINRVGEMLDSLEEKIENMKLQGPMSKGTIIVSPESKGIEFQNVTLAVPTKEKVLAQVEKGKGLLIMGESGCGKSSILRAIAGIWTINDGKIIVNSKEQIFLPQKPYMIHGATLREQMYYPMKPIKSTPQETNRLRQVLSLLNLDLENRFGGFDCAQSYWEDILSQGEQQRVALCRVLIHPYSLVFLDECTSALDVDNEKRFYQKLRELGCTYVSVGHRPSLKKFHDDLLVCEGKAKWTLKKCESKEEEDDFLTIIEEENPDEKLSISKFIDEDAKVAAKTKNQENQQHNTIPRIAILSRVLLQSKKGILFWITSFICSVILGITLSLGTLINPRIYAAILTHQEKAFWTTTVFQLLLVSGIGLFGGLNGLSSAFLSIMWRTRLTENIHKTYFWKKIFYRILCVDRTIDNPDQRICSDVGSFTDAWASLFFDSSSGLVVTIVQFVAALVFIHDSKMIYVLVGALVLVGTYAILLAIFNHFISKWTYIVSKKEGTYRYFHARIRTYSESIAFYRGEELEEQLLRESFNELLSSLKSLAKWNAASKACQIMFGVIAQIWGLVITGIVYCYILPLPFTENPSTETLNLVTTMLNMSSVMTSSFVAVFSCFAGIGSLMGFANRSADFWLKLEQQRISISDHILKNFNNEKKGVQQEPEKEMSHMISVYEDGVFEESDHIEFDDVTLKNPADTIIAHSLGFTVKPSERMIIMGKSGCGKSSLLRAIAGLWPIQSGKIRRPFKNVFFLPQRPYIVLGSLQDQILYPYHNEKEKIDQSKMTELLSYFHLEHLLSVVDNEYDRVVKWDDMLSLGEQQRLSMVRLFYHEPKFVIIDEGTSALDVTLQQKCYEMLVKKNLTVLSVAHRPEVKKFHQLLLQHVNLDKWKLVH